MTRPATTHTTEAAIDDAGATAFSIIDADPYRSNAEHRRQLLRWDLRVGGGAQITSFETGLDDDPTGFGPSATDDGQKVDGSNLRQVTAHTSDLLGFAWPTISDDGTRIAYLQSQGASDGLWQIAGVLQNGTGFHRLTSFPNLQPGYARISGNGQSVGFQRYGPLPVVAGGCEGGSQIAIVDWDATGLQSIAAPCVGDAALGYAGAPDITDDARTLFYPADEFGFEIWRRNRDLSNWYAVTDTWSQPGPKADCDRFVRAAGGGGPARRPGR